MHQRSIPIAALVTLLAAGAAGAAPPTEEPGLIRRDVASQASIHFQGPDGGIVRGVRCGAPGVTAAEQALVTEALRWATERGFTASAAGDKVIPVAWHVVYGQSGKGRNATTAGNIPTTMILDQIDVLNAAFDGLGFQFTLASVDRTNNDRWFSRCENSRIESQMKQALAIDPAHTLNIYSCQPGQGILGYAYFPWSAPEGHYIHGVVLLHSSLPGGSAEPYNQGDTGTHEVGHYLGLYHTFQNGCSAPGDEVADTPYESSPAFGCPVGRDSCTQTGLDPITNFMDYTDDACMITFTSDQSTRMQALVSQFRPSL